ncbi:MAG: hypothetical protein AAGU14_05305 [Eubacteriaceae bacterium]
MRKFYDYLSDFIHAGITEHITRETLIKLSEYVLLTLKKMIISRDIIGDKKTYLELLNESAFGSNPYKINYIKSYIFGNYINDEITGSNDNDHFLDLYGFGTLLTANNASDAIQVKENFQLFLNTYNHNDFIPILITALDFFLFMFTN